MKEEAAGASPPLNDHARNAARRARRRKVVFAVAIFLLTFGVRLLTWHDTRLEAPKVQWGVTRDYQRIANLLSKDGVRGFFSSSSALADPNNLGHPPGYSILLALIGESNTRIQLVQIVADSLSAVLIMLTLAELFSLAPAVLAGLFAALSPQFAWNSVLLLPDSLAVFPILVAIYLLARARRKSSWLMFLFIGAVIGISCWLRANALLLPPFIAIVVLVLCGKKNWRAALLVICGALLVIAPLTLRNAVVFHHFIPLSLGAGQTLLEGIGDYDSSGRFGIPNTDMEIMRQEAEMYQRPDYYGTLFNPDGVARERARLKRGAGVILSHPLWFAGVMARRAAMMIRLERVPIVHLGSTKFLRAIHRLFITAVFLPLALLGVGLTIHRREISPLLVLSVVPLYYFTTQSVFHTEYRYVLAVSYFAFAFAAVGMAATGGFVIKKIRAFRQTSLQSNR